MEKLRIHVLRVMCCVLMLCSSWVLPQGSTTVIKSGKDDAPKVRFEGIQGSPALSTQIKSDLRMCGWFDVVETGGEMVIRGAANAGGVTIQVQGGPVGSFSFAQQRVVNDVETSHRAVDQVLKKVFGIKGICSYKIAFTRQISEKVKEIYICDFDGRNARQVTRNRTASIEPAWGPANRTILYTLYSPFQTYIAETNLSTGMSRKISTYNGMNAGPAVSPRGNSYACMLSKDGRVELYLRGYPIGTAIRLTKTKGTEASPCFSPDGSQICFVTDQGRENRPYLCRISASGGSYARISGPGVNQTSPDWSLDHKIVYAAATQQGSSICVTDLSGKATKGVGIIAGGGFESPSWAPDNRHVVCQQTSGRRSSLWVIDTWTGKKRQLFSNATNTSLPAWQK